MKLNLLTFGCHVAPLEPGAVCIVSSLSPTVVAVGAALLVLGAKAVCGGGGGGGGGGVFWPGQRACQQHWRNTIPQPSASPSPSDIGGPRSSRNSKKSTYLSRSHRKKKAQKGSTI